MKTYFNFKNLVYSILILFSIFFITPYQNISIEKDFSNEVYSFVIPLEEEFNNYTIEEIATGTSHSGAIITDDKDNDYLYTWGNNNDGQLGLGDEFDKDPYITTPTQVTSLSKGRNLSHLSMGDNHSAIVVDNYGTDELYLWGDNKNGQLGLGDDYSDEEYNTPQLLDKGIPSEAIIKDVSLGTQDSAVVTTNEQGNDSLYTWGENTSGKLGNFEYGDVESYYNTPQKVTSLPTSDIEQISLGGNTSSAIVKNNGTDELYTWGSNTYGQLGDPNANNEEHGNQYKPMKVSDLPENSTIKQVSLGCDFSAAITNDSNDDDHLYTWGHNNLGQLGLGYATNEYQPLEVTDLPYSDNIKQVSMGKTHSAAVTTDEKGNDHLYTWGNNKYGQLGLGNYNNKDDPNLCYYNTPQEVDLPKGNITNISLGKDYSMAVISNEKGTTDSLYVWGLNKVGQLGLGNDEKTSSPILQNKEVEIDVLFTDHWYFYLAIAIASAIVLSLLIYLLIKLINLDTFVS